ncbi:unnamed protein product [Oikopleura dioica]|uniref:GHMP kinase N-terminal domain-containing protein n=1 Tax=Oikopleura dioica TaxID=34765 RepID=E4X8Z1_OIKDI|nr:unnamed protein product [Oikopleura dioica]
MGKSEKIETRGIVELDINGRITNLIEKPTKDETQSRLASVVFYVFSRETLDSLPDFLRNSTTPDSKSFGNYLSRLISENKCSFHGLKIPTRFSLIGRNVGLAEYQELITFFNNKKLDTENPQKYTARTYARVGLMGNPSDGFYGKTIALSIKNFWASATIQESASLNLIPHPLNDPTSFGSMADLHAISCREGYFGGLRLLQATCKAFYSYCRRNGIVLSRKNFTLSYDTNIPRQVGLAGSSAIVTSTLKCLMNFFNLTENDLPKPKRASLALDVETSELFIQAGLQDRVVQTYEGLVDMDFAKDLVEKQGYGHYENLKVKVLPTLFLVYCPNPSDSGKIHSTVKHRWLSEDKEVIEGMNNFRNFTTEARVAIEAEHWSCLQKLMDKNFEQRRILYGDACLGDDNLKLISIAKEHGASAKFSGSGGAIVGLLLEESKEDQMKRAFQKSGFVYIRIIPHFPEAYP